MTFRPMFSIITVNRNNSAGLRRTLTSTVQQSFTDFEHVVVDGASTDGSIVVISEFRDRLAYAVSEPDAGIYNAMNKGIAAAQGEFLLFLNSGDHLATRDSLENAAPHLGKHDLCYFDLDVCESAAAITPRTRVKTYPDTLRFSHFLNDTLPHPACFIRRSLFQRFGGYDETLKICADWKAFMLWVCRHNCSYEHISQVLSVYYADGVSSHPESRGAIASEHNQVLQAEFPAFVQDGRDAIESRDALHQVAALRRSRFVRGLQAAGLLWRF